MKKEHKYFILFIAFFSLTFILCGFIKWKVYQEKEKIVYLIDEGLVAIHLKFDKKNTPLVSEVELLDDDAKILYKNVNFVDKSLIDVVDECIKGASDNYLVKVHVWTNWDNIEYFQKSHYNIDAKFLSKENLDNLKDIVKPVFLLDQKYYKVGASHDFAITFLNGGLMEYHVDAYEDAVCVGYYGENCKKTIVDDAYYKKYMAHHRYSINALSLKMDGDGKDYFRYKEAKHECVVQYNRIKCSFFNRAKDDKDLSETIEYYEIRDEK